MSVAITVTHRAKPGMRDEVRKVWEPWMPAAISSNVGHIAYAYTFDHGDADVIRAFQVYPDADAAAAYLQNDSYRQYVEAVEPLLMGPPNVTTADVMWSKGISNAR